MKCRCPPCLPAAQSRSGWAPAGGQSGNQRDGDQVEHEDGRHGVGDIDLGCLDHLRDGGDRRRAAGAGEDPLIPAPGTRMNISRSAECPAGPLIHRSGRESIAAHLAEVRCRFAAHPVMRICASARTTDAFTFGAARSGWRLRAGRCRDRPLCAGSRLGARAPAGIGERRRDGKPIAGAARRTGQRGGRIWRGAGSERRPWSGRR